MTTLTLDSRFMAQYPIWGGDGSQHMDRKETAKFPDLNVLANMGATILGWKISQGEGDYGFEDRTWRQVWEQVRQINAARMRLYRLPFHFWDYAASHYLGSAELFGARQARKCRNAIKADPGEVPLHLDVEPYTPWGPINWLTASRPMEIARGFLKEYDQLVGSLTPIYTSPDMLRYFGDFFKSRALWLAWYNEFRTWASIDAELKKYGWRGQAWLWQYASDGDLDENGTADGIALGMEEAPFDLNVCRLSIEEFSRFCGNTPAPMVPVVEDPVTLPTPEPVSGRTKVIELMKVPTRDGLNIRSLAGKPSTITGWLPAGKEIEVLEKVRNGSDTWARVGQGQYAAIEFQGSRYLE